MSQGSAMASRDFVFSGSIRLAFPRSAGDAGMASTLRAGKAGQVHQDGERKPEFLLAGDGEEERVVFRMTEAEGRMQRHGASP